MIMATKQKTVFSVCKKDVVLVKPAEAIPSELLSLSTTDNSPTLELHCQTIHVYEANPHATTDPVSVLKEALSRVLVYYYPLAGKAKRYKDGKIRITCDPEDDSVGVPFLEATADCKLSDLGYFEEDVDASDVRSFFFDYSPSKGADVDGYYHPLVMQVTKFACGGFTFAMGLLHSVCDGFGAIQFFQALGELASGNSELSVKPVWERERWLQGTPSDQLLSLLTFNLDDNDNDQEDSSTHDHDDMVHEWFNIEAEDIDKLKTICSPQHHGQYDDHLVISEHARPSEFTSLEILGSFVWRARFRALEQNLDRKAGFRLIMGMKHLINPPLPQGYYGNAIVTSRARLLTGKELVEGSLHDIAKVIKECKKQGSNGDYVKVSLDILETMIQRNISVPTGGTATVYLTDWRQLGSCEVADFGWRKPVNMIALPWSMIGHHDNCVILTPNYKRRPVTSATTTKGGRGARILISLPRDAMTKFKEEMDAALRS